jgi:uncharacterized protein (TIGR00255 family)
MKSMTGFARTDGVTGPFTWAWEARSVNGRGLDIRLRLPPGFEAMEPRVREMAAAALTRGNVAINLTVKRSEGGGEIRLNKQAVAVIAEAVGAMRQALAQPAQVNIDGLLALRGVLEYAEPIETEAEADARSSMMLAGLAAAMTGLTAARTAEGSRLEQILSDQLGEVERLVALVAASPARAPAAIAARLKEQVDRLLGQAGNALDSARLAQEAALLATKNDVEEEIKRLTAHVEGARDLLTAKEPVGRKFDFLTQEFNREANTLCSKSNDTDMTRAGLALKAVIDQMREQVQNIE